MSALETVCLSKRLQLQISQIIAISFSLKRVSYDYKQCSSVKLLLPIRFTVFFYPCTTHEVWYNYIVVPDIFKVDEQWFLSLITKMNNIQFEAHPVLKQNSVKILNLRPEPTRTTSDQPRTNKSLTPRKFSHSTVSLQPISKSFA